MIDLFPVFVETLSHISIPVASRKYPGKFNLVCENAFCSAESGPYDSIDDAEAAAYDHREQRMVD